MRTALAAQVAVLVAALALPTAVVARQVEFNLPAQVAVTAIPEFARQAGVQIIAPADELKSVRMPAVKGVLEVRTALDRLIASTGLQVLSADDEVIVLGRGAPRPSPPPLALSETVRRPPPRSLPASAIEVDTLVVFGGGQARQTQIVRGDDLQALPPGANPLRLVSKLPSVNFQSADAFGANEFSTRISVRNFNQSRLGFTLDDVPLGDMSYGNHNGLHVSRAIIGENLDAVELSQGAGSLETASSSNLGGTIKFISRDPAERAGGFAAASVGSDRTARTVLRLESGERPGGLRAYAAYAYNTTERWQGQGRQYSEQLNLKAVQPVGEGLLTGFLNLSRRRESDPQDLSLEMLHRLGAGWDNIPGDWGLAVRLAEIGANRGDTGVLPQNPEAGAAFPAPITGINDTYYDATTARDDVLTGLTLRLPLSPKLDIKSTVYGHWDKGQDLWWTPFVASPSYGVEGATRDDAPISLQSTEYDIRRRGLLSAVTYKTADHVVSAGLWFETNDFVQARRFYGLGLAAPQRSYDGFQKDAFQTDWAYRFTTRTQQFYLQDVWSVSEALTVTAGFKSLSVTNQVATRAGPDKDGKIRAVDHFLPRLSARYQLGPDNEVFANYGRGMRAFTSSNTSGPFAASEADFDRVKSTLRPEISDNFELGWRRSTPRLTLLTAIYDVRFRNRLFLTPTSQGNPGDPGQPIIYDARFFSGAPVTPAGGVAIPAFTLANVGSVTAYGVEAAASWRFAADWSLYASYAFNHAIYDDDVFDSDGVVIAKTAGKLPVDAPVHLAKANLDYSHGGFFGHLALSYLSERYFTFENDSNVPAQFVADLAGGYRFSGPGLASGAELQLNVSNLFDRRYISTIGSRDFPIRGDAQTLLAGPARQVFVTLRKAF